MSQHDDPKAAVTGIARTAARRRTRLGNQLVATALFMHTEPPLGALGD